MYMSKNEPIFSIYDLLSSLTINVVMKKTCMLWRLVWSNNHALLAIAIKSTFMFGDLFGQTKHELSNSITSNGN